MSILLYIPYSIYDERVLLGIQTGQHTSICRNKKEYVHLFLHTHSGWVEDTTKQYRQEKQSCLFSDYSVGISAGLMEIGGLQ